MTGKKYIYTFSTMGAGYWIDFSIMIERGLDFRSFIDLCLYVDSVGGDVLDFLRFYQYADVLEFQRDSQQDT